MKTLHFRPWSSSLLGTALLALAACGGGSSATAPGTLGLAITDTPVDGAMHVTLAFTAVQVQGDDMNPGMDMMDMDMMGMDMSSNGTTMTYSFAKDKTIDLLQQQDGRSAALLSGVSIPPGSYTSITFAIDALHSSITLADGSVHPLSTASGGVFTLNQAFEVKAGGTSGFTVDFDLRQAIAVTGGNYTLAPALRMVDDGQAGSISGSASNTAMIAGKAISDPSCMAAAYIFAGEAMPANPSSGSGPQPLTTATLKLDNTNGNYAYTAAFLPAGPYTVAFTCSGLASSADAAGIAFVSPQATMVTARGMSMVNLP